MVSWAAYGNTENLAGIMEFENQQRSFKNQLRMEMAKYFSYSLSFSLEFLTNLLNDIFC